MKLFLDTPFELKDMTATGGFAGYGSTYGKIDQGGDIVLAGAFTKSLMNQGSKGRMPAMLWQHRSGEPIGAYTKMTDDANGLYVEGQLCMKVQRALECYELMKMKAISGLSIGYGVTADNYDAKNGIRTIAEAELYEVSPVTFPMNDDARVAAVKTIDEIGDLSGAELYLREAGGISRSEAKALVGRIAAVARREAGAAQDESAELKAITALLRRRTALLAA